MTLRVVARNLAGLTTTATLTDLVTTHDKPMKANAPVRLPGLAGLPATEAVRLE